MTPLSMPPPTSSQPVVAALPLVLLLLVLSCGLCAVSGSPPSSASASAWSVVEVQGWLCDVVGLCEYRERFGREAIDGEALMELTAEELQTALGVDKLGHRKRMEKEILRLRAHTQRTQQQPLPPPPPPTSGSPSAFPSSPPPSSSRPPSPPPPLSSAPAGAAQFEAAAAAAAKRKRKKGGGDGAGRSASPAAKPKKRLSDKPHPLAVTNKPRVHLSEAERAAVRDLLREALAAHQSGALERARAMYEAVLERDPFQARALHMLGLVVMVADNDFSAATSLLERSLELSDDSDCHVNLANFHWQAGHREEAMSHWAYAIDLQVLAGGTATRIRYADTAFSLGMEVYNEGNTERCKQLLVLAIRLLTEAEMLHYPLHHHPPPYLPDSEEMRTTNLQLTHQLRVTLIDSWLHVGLLAEQEDDLALALVCYNRALQVQPDPLDESKPPNTRIATIRLEAQSYRASLLGRTRELPNSPLAKGKIARAEHEADNLAVDRTAPREKKLVEFLHKTCHFAEAQRLAALIVDDIIFHSPSYRFLFDNSTQILQDRARYDAALRDLLADPAMAGLWSAPIALEWCRFRFYLAYHGLNNRELNERLAQVYLYMTPSLAYTAPHLRKDQVVQWDGARKIRVAFVSAFLTHHPVGRTVQGYVEHLPRDRFEVLVFFITLQPNVDNDYLLLNMQRWADTFVRLPVERIQEARDLINAHRPDVLIYADIGMEPTSFFLAFSRLAPVQALTFGHPDTSGLTTIDYFLSHTDMDQPDVGQEYYTERLVALEGVGYWHQSNVPSRFQGREELGLADHQLGLLTPPTPPGASHAWTMYLVTKSIQFYSPDFMDAVAHILHRHPTSFVALLVDIGRTSRGFDVHNQCQESILDGIESRLHALNLGLSTSAAHSSPPVPVLDRSAISGRVRFVDKGDHDYFMSLLHMTDVLLQPMPLDGTTTTLEAISIATPTVLFEGATIGGRMGQAMYRHMGITANIAHSKEEYVDIAVRLGQDRQFNAWLRAEMEEKRETHRLYQDPAAIQALATWLQQAVRDSNGKTWS